MPTLTAFDAGINTDGKIIGVDLDLNPFLDGEAFTSGTLSVVSDSADDTLAGTGCQKVQIEFIDPVAGISSEVYAMNGLAAVTVPAGGLERTATRVRDMDNAQADDTSSPPYVAPFAAPAGIITASIGGVAVARIKPGDGRMRSMLLSTHPGKVERVITTTASITSAGPNSGINLQAYTRTPVAGWRKSGPPLVLEDAAASAAIDFSSIGGAVLPPTCDFMCILEDPSVQSVDVITMIIIE